MIAGLGITGLALALAAKDSVSNIFGAVSIIIDQPFNVGDWIIVDDVEGEVITIGLRTTMIRTGNDTIVTMPNSNITNSPVENFTMRRFRRIRPVFEFEEETDEESLKKFWTRYANWFYPILDRQSLRTRGSKLPEAFRQG